MIEQEYRNRINHVIKAIIRHPEGLAGNGWTTETLAGLAGISAFHRHLDGKLREHYLKLKLDETDKLD